MSILETLRQQSEQAEAKNLAAFMLLAGRHAQGEELPAKEITAICTKAGKTLNELEFQIAIAASCIKCAAAIQAEADQAAEEPEFWKQLEDDRAARLREVDHVKALVVKFEEAQRISLAIEEVRLKKNEELRMSASAAIKKLQTLDVEAYGISVPPRAAIPPKPNLSHLHRSIPAYGWGETHLNSAILTALNALRRPGRLVSDAGPVVPPPTDEESQLIESPEFLERLKRSWYAVTLVRAERSQKPKDAVSEPTPIQAKAIPTPLKRSEIDDDEERLDPTALLA